MILSSLVDDTSANLLRFNLPVLSRASENEKDTHSRVAVAYTLMDGGASHKFVRPALVAAIEAASGTKLEKRQRGTMELTSAGKVEVLPREQVQLTLKMGRMRYTGWFTVYNLVKYDVILGKDWMEEVKHTIDHDTNTLTSLNAKEDIRLRGLPRGVEREGETATEWVEKAERHSDEVELMVVEQVVAYIDLPGKSSGQGEGDIPITACQELHSTRQTQPVSARTRRLACLEPPLSLEKLFAMEFNGIKAASSMDLKIRKEYAELCKEPEGLPPHRPKFGDFRIQLLPGSRAPYRAPYRLTPAEWEEYKRQIQLYSSKGHIRRSRSLYAAPVLFVPKPGGAPGELRMVIDYRALNAITIKDRFPLPLPEELIDKLQGKRFFSKMDFWSGYSQNRVATEDIEKTTFVGPDGLWEWLVIPQGIATAPAWFMRMVTELLAPHKAYCVVFIDDILIFSATQAEHERHVREVLDTLRKHGFRLKDKKCEFGHQETEFVGFRVDGKGIRLTEDKIASIAKWPMVQSPKDARIFLGLAGAYRKFVPKFAIKALPLFEVLNMSKHEFERHVRDPSNLARMEKAMAEVKKILTSEPCLALPEAGNCEFLVRTDASDFGIGATLRQFQRAGDDANQPSFEEKVLAYFSRKLHGAEKRYSTYDKELLAIRDALKHWRYYLLGRHTTISTDHASLRHMLKQPKLSQRQMRALEDMLEYDFDVEYLPGAKNYIQDALSRRPDYQEPPIPKIKAPGENGRAQADTPSTRSAMELFQLMLDDGEEWINTIRDGYRTDPYCRDIIAYLRPTGSPVPARQLSPAEARQYKADCRRQQAQGRHYALSSNGPTVPARQLSPAEARQYKADCRRQQARGRHYELSSNGLLTHRESGTLVIPNVWNIKERILREAHDSKAGGHFGTLRTHAAVARRFFWPRQFQEIKRYVRRCGVCARTKPSNEKPFGLLQPLDIPEERWRRINIDFVTKLPTTARGNDTIITIIDALTKRAHWIPTRETELTATKFAEIFRDAYVRLHGLPDVIVSDRDVRFTSGFWRTLMAEFDTKLAMSTAFHPQTDGQAEKANSMVERYLRAYTASRQGEWDQLLSLAEFAYNASRHQSLEMSPFEADLGYIPRMPLDAVAAVGLVSARRSPRGHRHSPPDGRSFAMQMANVLSQLKRSLQHAQEQQIAEANKHRQAHTF
jgi:hypothetical protein